MWIASYQLHAARADEENQLKSIRRAATGRRWVRPETAIEVLRAKFALEVRLGKLADALETYELLVSEAPAISADDPLVEGERNVRHFVDSDQVLAAEALLEKSGDECCDGIWGYQLLRRKFSIDRIDGEIKNIDIRCDWHRASEEFVSVGRLWEIPASWGKCHLYVHGNAGTTFRLLEMPGEHGAPGGISIVLHKPANGDIVAQRGIVKGHVTDPATDVWVVIHPVGTADYWIQPMALVGSDGAWHADTFFGRAGNVDNGKKFVLRAIANPQSTLKEGRSDRWPAAAARSEVIAVSRD